MADIEQGLKEAIAEAAAKRSTAQSDTYDYAPGLQRRGFNRIGLTAGNGAAEQGRPPLSAPEIIHLIEGLSKHAWGAYSQACELSGLLAGPGESTGALTEPAAPASIFDRMGQELLSLTRAIEGVEREINRGLGAVRP